MPDTHKEAETLLAELRQHIATEVDRHDRDLLTLKLDAYVEALTPTPAPSDVGLDADVREAIDRIAYGDDDPNAPTPLHDAELIRSYVARLTAANTALTEQVEAADALLRQWESGGSINENDRAAYRALRTKED